MLKVLSLTLALRVQSFALTLVAATESLHSLATLSPVKTKDWTFKTEDEAKDLAQRPSANVSARLKLKIR